MEIINSADRLKVVLNWHGTSQTAYVGGGRWSSTNKDLEHVLSLLMIVPGHHADIDLYLADSAVHAFGGSYKDTRRQIK